MSAATWSRAWRDASREFWSSQQPSAHFTTSAGSLVAERIASIVQEVDVRLGHPETLHVIDIGCGDGALLAHLQSQGVTINRPPRDGRMAFVRTPDLISIELLQKGAALPPQEPWLSMPNTGSW